MKRRVKIKERSELRVGSLIARSVLEKIKSKSIFLNLRDSSIVLRESECIRAVSETVDESPIRNLLLNCMLEAERISPGASYVVLCELADNIEHEISKGKRFSVDNLQHSLSLIIGDEQSDIVMKAVTIAGRKGKIILDSNNSQMTEISYGSQICKWKPSSSYFSSINQSKISAQNCRVVFVDGIIESVSECHNIFNESYEKKVPVVVFARGFAEEIEATAAINVQRQTAYVIPIVIPFDEVGVNGMGDLASCFSSELISSDKGQLISSIDLQSFPIAARITCSHMGTEIEMKNNKVDSVIKKLTSRLQGADQDQSDLIRRRLEHLGSSSVTIKIGNEKKSMSGMQKDRIDFGIRYVGSCMKHGVSIFDGILLPAKSVEAGVQCAKSFRNTLKECNVVLEVDSVVRS